jgi:hypothetical protein
MSLWVITIEMQLPLEMWKCSGAAQWTDPPMDEVTYDGPKVSMTMFERLKSERRALPSSSRRIFDWKQGLNEHVYSM